MPGFRRVKGFSGKTKKSDCQNTHFKQFFPSWTPPKGLRGNQENIVLICQQKSHRVTSTDTKYERRPRPTWQENKGIPKNN